MSQVWEIVEMNEKPRLLTGDRPRDGRTEGDGNVHRPEPCPGRYPWTCRGEPRLRKQAGPRGGIPDARDDEGGDGDPLPRLNGFRRPSCLFSLPAQFCAQAWQACRPGGRDRASFPETAGVCAPSLDHPAEDAGG